MKITEIVGREEHFSDREIDELYLQSDDLVRRMFRKVTTSGCEVQVNLPRGSILRSGDVLFVDERSMVVVRVQPEWVLVIRPVSFANIAQVGHQLGNRHLPIQIFESEILVAYHNLLEELFTSLSIPCTRELRTLDQPFLHIFAPHSH